MERLPLVLVHSCIVPFAPFDEVLHDWPLISKRMREAAQVEHKRRAHLFSGLQDFVLSMRRGEGLRLPLLPALVAIHPGQSVSVWAVTTMAHLGQRRPVRMGVVYRGEDHARRSLEYVRRMIDERFAGLTADAMSLRVEEFTRRGLTLVPFGLQRGHHPLADQFRQLRSSVVDVIFSANCSLGLATTLLAKNAKLVVESDEGTQAVLWLDPDPRYRARCARVFAFAKAACGEDRLSSVV